MNPRTNRLSTRARVMRPIAGLSALALVLVACNGNGNGEGDDNGNGEDLTLAVLSGAVDEDYAEWAGVPSDNIELFADVSAQYEALIAGRVDAVGGTSLTVQEQVEANSDEMEATEFFFPEGPDGEELLPCGGYGFLDQEFRDEFNDVLSEKQEDGTVMEITTGFGFAEEDVERATDLTVQDVIDAEPEADEEEEAAEEDEAEDVEEVETEGMLDELQDAGSVTIGIANEVPYGFEDEDGTITGQAPEVAREVLAEMGIDDVDAEIVDFGALIPGLQAGQFDMIAAGMFITSDRAEQILFTDPDYCVSYSFAVEPDNPNDITGFEDFAGAEE